MEYAVSIGIGYLLGSLNPAALIARLKKQNIRASGTKNLGATNVMMHFGKGFGALVMLFDVFKAAGAVWIVRWIFPEIALVGILGGCAAVMGHIFPFYLKFKGGKGLAAFGGMVLGVNPFSFLVLLIFCSALILIVNYSVFMPVTAAILFPLLLWLRTGDPIAALVALLTGGVLIFKFRENLVKVKNRTEVKVRGFLSGKQKTEKSE